MAKDEKVSEEQMGRMKQGDIIARRYRVLGYLGSGGIGDVYRVSHLLSGKEMALKLLHNHVARHIEAEDRFQQEIRRLGQLSHPHIRSFFDCGYLQGGDLYLVMELVAGEDLESFLRKGVHFAWPLVVEVGVQLCDALRHAHERGILHRNLKPANVMLMQTEGAAHFVQVLDFGLTSSVEAAQQGKAQIPVDAAYCAPEIQAGEAPSNQSDIYALGALLVALLRGKPREGAEKDAPLSLSPPHEDLPQPPESLRALLESCLAKESTSRPASAQSLHDALTAILRAKEDLQHPPLSADLEDIKNAANQRITQAEWERVERAWRWRARARWGILVLAFLGLGLWGWSSYRTREMARKHDAIEAQKLHTQEREPNHDALHATRIPLNQEITGQLGKALAADRSDRDWFRFHLPKAQRLMIRLQPPANLDAELGLYRLKIVNNGTSRATYEHIEIASRNNAHRGGEERFPSLWLEEGDYFLLVRELVVHGEAPQEDLGSYKLIVQPLPNDPTIEREPNDQITRALPASLHKEYRGYHDRSGDIDFFRFTIPPHKEVNEKLDACKDCPPRKRRVAYLRKLWKDQPIYRLTFYSLDKITVKLDLLNAQAQPIMTVPRELMDEVEGRKHRPLVPPRIELNFSSEGIHALRVETISGNNTKTPYRWKIERLPLR